MSEFSNRISAQRHILQIVNGKRWEREELLGLSSKAIDRWISSNQLNSEDPLVSLIKTASSKLFFLANKSQEQISEEYKMISKELADISERIRLEVS